MRNLKKEIKTRTINYKELLKYGFKKKNEKYIFKKNIYNDEFEIIVEVTNNEITSKLFDIINGEEYVLVDVEDAVGEFVGKVRTEYEKILNDIINKCTVKEVFKSNQAKEVIKYVSQKYKDDLEFLWEKLADTAICRNKQNDKWYLLFGIIPENKIGIQSDRKVEMIDVRYNKGETNKIVDFKKVFPGYHMNKDSWITIKLDNTVETEEILSLIDNSYNLSIGKRESKTVSDLSKKVYEFLTLIPKGKVVTYKQIAEYLGNKGLARVVGTILHKNPDGDKYPCYKVLNSKGELAEAFVFGGKNIQKKRLEKDGIKVIDFKVDLNKYQWKE